jgi:hypothetical protein
MVELSLGTPVATLPSSMSLEPTSSLSLDLVSNAAIGHAALRPSSGPLGARFTWRLS